MAREGGYFLYNFGLEIGREGGHGGQGGRLGGQGRGGEKLITTKLMTNDHQALTNN